MKQLLIFILIVSIAIGSAIYVFREKVVQYSAETILKNNLPEYVTVEELVFDMDAGTLEAKGFAIKNPPGYQDKYLATMDSISCRYIMSGSTILDGIEITEILAESPRINIERAANGRFNLNDMGDMMSATEDTSQTSTKDADSQEGSSNGFKLSDLIKLTDTIRLQKGKIIFLDKKIARNPYMITFEDVSGTIRLKFNKDYTRVIDAGTKGSGFLNADRSQRIDWKIDLDPTAEELKMGTRFEVSGLDITIPKPYYDKYSPIDVRSGRARGTLVFDFDNGNIGSMNTLTLSGLSFVIKEDGRGYSGWQASMIPKVIRYLQSSPGEVTFDFSIKGNIESPTIYPGPHVKSAIQLMAVDTIADMLRKDPSSEEGAEQQNSGTAPSSDNRSDAEVVVDTLKGLWNQYKD